MRFCGGFLRFEQLSCPKQGHQSGSTAGKSVRAAFFPIDDADGDSTLQPSLPERFQGFQGGSAGGDDVLDEAHALARFEGSFDPIRGSVFLRLVTDDHERQARGERGCRRDDDCTELRARNAHGFGLVLRDCGGNVVTEHGEQVGPGLEAVLVEVVARAAPRTKDEVAFEVRVLAKSAGELFARQDRAARIASRANGMRRAPWGESPSTEIIEPSAK
jgi:hypothetical protein